MSAGASSTSSSEWGRTPPGSSSTRSGGAHWRNPEARYATVALDACAPQEIADRSLVVRADIAAVRASAVHQDRALD